MQIQLIILTIFLFGINCVWGWVAYKLYRNCKMLRTRFSELLGKLEFLEEKYNQTINYYNYNVNYSSSNYNYLAIGNSLTMIASWGRGICSTLPNNDYFGLLTNYLRDKYGECVSYSYNFSPWERASNRSTTLELLDVYLDERLDLVTVQLGENVSNTTTFLSDLENLIDYIRDKAPKAKIIILGDWFNKGRNEIRREGAKNKNVLFADFSEIIGDEDYRSSVGQICYLEDGNIIKVGKSAATHPGDKGMKYIADKIINILEK